MSPEQAAALILSTYAVKREDIARAKSYILRHDDTNTNGLVSAWLVEQNLETRDVIRTDAADAEEVLKALGRAFSVRVAFYSAVWELASAGRLYPSHPASEWKPTLTYNDSRNAGAIPLASMTFYFLPHIHRPPLVEGPDDPDIFLQGIDAKSLHPGIREAIDQSLDCFRRGLYMPAIAMLAAAVEATWTECGRAVATKLANAKLESVVRDPMSSIAKIVLETRKALEDSIAKPLLKAAGQSISKVSDAEVWTTVLREKRNALHWSKGKGFIADHSETATLLLAAPVHLDTLEAIRKAC